jgi:bifunctional non-homologous end joining protein LigD
MVIPLPLPLTEQLEAFDDLTWVFEFKHDGLRALAVIEQGICRLLSRHKHELDGFHDLRTALVREVEVDNAVLDGQLAVLDARDRTISAPLMEVRRQAQYVAFDLLWFNGEDWRAKPLLERKDQLRRLLPSRSTSVRYVEHVRGVGRQLYHLACEMDLEGIVAKPAISRYELEGPSPWILIKNPFYRQKATRGGSLRRAV